MTINKPDLAFILSHPVYFLSFGFGSGLSHAAPGTMGTIAAIPLYYILQLIFPDLLVLGLIIIILNGLGIYFCDKTGKAIGDADFKGIVWDEIGAFLAVLYLCADSFLAVLYAFLLFRLFDIWKPFPISYFDKNFKNGFGVMLDDWLAASYAVILFQLSILFSSW